MPLAIPNFGALLAEAITSVPEAARVGFLARLERVAGQRYRDWAEQKSEHKEDLLACAAREDEIARRAEALSPIASEHEALVSRSLVDATRIYGDTFDGLTLQEQLELQAYAERQGSLAWKNFSGLAKDDATREEFDALGRLEIENAAALDAILGIHSSS